MNATPSNPLTIRRATPADADVLAAYNSAMALETERRALEPALIGAGVRAALADERRGIYYVAEHDGRVIGQLFITYEWSDWRNGVFWWIQSVYVTPDARRQGVYRALHQAVAAAARQTPGVCGLRLYVERENARAQQTYRRLGMQQTHYLLFEDDWAGTPL